MDMEGQGDSHPLAVLMWLTQPLGGPGAQTGEWTPHKKQTVAWSPAVPGKTVTEGKG